MEAAPTSIKIIARMSFGGLSLKRKDFIACLSFNGGLFYEKFSPLIIAQDLMVESIINLDLNGAHLADYQKQSHFPKWAAR
jgi:hypothetical protein